MAHPAPTTIAGCADAANPTLTAAPAIVLTLALAMFGVATPANAEATAADLLKAYDEGSAEERHSLEQIIDGNSNGVSWMNSYLDEFRGAESQVYCPPDDFVVDGAGIIQMMRAAIASDERYANLPYGATVMFSYIVRFPCP